MPDSLPQVLETKHRAHRDMKYFSKHLRTCTVFNYPHKNMRSLRVFLTAKELPLMRDFCFILFLFFVLFFKSHRDRSAVIR